MGAYLEDHAFLLEALITLYETTFDPRWYREAVSVADEIIERFSDPERGGFFTTPADHEHAGRAPQGPRGLADPVGQLGGGVRAAAAGAAVGRGQVRAPRAGRPATAVSDRAAPSGSVRPPAAGRRLLPGAGARGRDRGTRPRAAAARRPRARTARTSCWPAARPTACRCSRDASRSTGEPPPTCASTSSARRRSPSRRSSRRLCDVRGRACAPPPGGACAAGSSAACGATA